MKDCLHSGSLQFDDFFLSISKFFEKSRKIVKAKKKSWNFCLHSGSLQFDDFFLTITKFWILEKISKLQKRKKIMKDCLHSDIFFRQFQNSEFWKVLKVTTFILVFCIENDSKIDYLGANESEWDFLLCF